MRNVRELGNQFINLMYETLTASALLSIIKNWTSYLLLYLDPMNYLCSNQLTKVTFLCHYIY